MKRLVVALGLATAMWVAPGLAQSDAVQITADRFFIEENAHLATFTGNVVIEQPDLTVWAQKVVVHYGPGGPSDLESLEAEGGVRVKQPDQTATGDHGTYDPKAKILKLFGNVVVVNDSGTVKGPELVVDIANGTTEFSTTSGGRVTGVFTPKE